LLLQQTILWQPFFSIQFSAWLRAKHVYGYEVVPEAIADARKNAKLNGIDNATFVQGDLNKINESFGKEFPKPDIIISGLYGSYNATVLWHSNFIMS
jgi:tRNA G37 N-methylase Trm5